MIADDNENFVSRWSRRKSEARKAEEKPAEPAPSPELAPPAVPAGSSADAAAAAAAAPSGAGVQSAVTAPQLPPIESLNGLASEYRDFMQPGVDDNVKRSALKRLFRDPHFENFERFEAYCEDYTQGEPIPLAMLKTLEHAKGLLFDEEKREEKSVVAEKPAAALPKPDEAPQVQAIANTESPAAAAQPQEKT
jgi:hypothetical protein